MVDHEAYVSLAVNDTYAASALVLGDSLRETNTNRKLALLVTANITQFMRVRLAKVWDHLIDAETICHECSTGLFERPDLEKIFMKLKIWTLTQFQKCVFLDADVLVLQNVDDLFEKNELSAAPDIGWPDCFNSGVLVFTPSKETYCSLLKHAENHGSFDENLPVDTVETVGEFSFWFCPRMTFEDEIPLTFSILGSDQGLLNTFFKDWSTNISKRLPYTYNMVSSASYTYAPAVNYFGDNVKIVHFDGASKPWSQHYDYGQSRAIGPPSAHSGSRGNEYLNSWWNRYHKLHESLPLERNDTAFTDSKENYEDSKRDGDHVNYKVSDQQRAWERGEIDFTRKDRFSVIQHYLNNTIDGSNSEPLEDFSCEQNAFEDEYGSAAEEFHYSSHFERNLCGNEEARNVKDESSVALQSSGPFTVERIQLQSENQEQWKEEAATDSEAVVDGEAVIDGEVGSSERIVHEPPEEVDPDVIARLRWETDNIDINGEDRFANIEKHLNSLLSKFDQFLRNEHTKAYDEVDFKCFNKESEARADSNISPVLSSADSAYSEILTPERISRSTQTIFFGQSKAVQTELATYLR